MSSDSETKSETKSETSHDYESNQHKITVDDEYSSPTEVHNVDDYVHANYETNRYIQSLLQNADLQILQPDLVKRAYCKNKELGLFHLFLTPSLIECFRSWTDISMKKRNCGGLSVSKFNAYLGLEIAMSLTHCNNIYDYWSGKRFFGSRDIPKVMKRNDFTNIRSNVKLYPTYVHDIATNDPLWHSRIILENFIRNAVKIAVPDGPFAIDENTIRCKGRTRAKTYMKNKPIKFGIRFYAVVGWKYTYLHSLWDNGSGNKTKFSAASRYCTVFRDMKQAFDNIITNDPEKILLPESASALWALQISHLHKMSQSPSGKRVVFMDNFYTRHPLARKIKQLTNNEIKVIGTVKLNSLDAYNKKNITEAIERMKTALNGDWLLVQCFDSVPLRNKKAKKIKKEGSSSRKRRKTEKDDKQEEESPPIAEKTGYVIFKDKKIVVFYCNDLAFTPKKLISGASDLDAIDCVHGLAELKRWSGQETFHRTRYNVPAIIVAYNMFMNSVDRFDQYRQTNSTVRREKRVPMSILTFLLDAAINNAYALFQKLKIDKSVNFTEFKRRIAEQLAPEVINSVVQDTSVDTNVSVSLDQHMLVQNNDNKRNECYLCRLLKPDDWVNKKGVKPSKATWTINTCVQCKKAFCLNCFNAYHNYGMLQQDHPFYANIIENKEANKRRNGKLRTTAVKTNTTLKNMHFNFDKYV